MEVGLGRRSKRRGGDGIELQMEVDLKIFTLSTCKNQGAIILKRHPGRGKVGEINDKMNILRPEVLMKHLRNSTVKTIIIITIKY